MNAILCSGIALECQSSVPSSLISMSFAEARACISRFAPSRQSDMSTSTSRAGRCSRSASKTREGARPKDFPPLLFPKLSPKLFPRRFPNDENELDENASSVSVRFIPASSASSCSDASFLCAGPGGRPMTTVIQSVCT